MNDPVHISCGHGRPLGAKLFPSRFKSTMECHCLFFPSERGHVLVDTGLSTAELDNPRQLGWFARGLGLQTQPERAACRQIEGLGFDPTQVTDIVLTHLDLDHAGGLVDFPEARVHVSSAELAAARVRRTTNEKFRYVPRQWEKAEFVPHDVAPGDGPRDGRRILEIGDWQLSLVSLPGHTRGHCGVLAAREDRELLHCGDTYYDRSELDDRGGWLFRAFRRSVDVIPKKAEQSRRCVAEWAESCPDLQVFSSHDPEEFRSCVEAAD